ncbi:MAG: hypothetical protein WCX71_03160 [Candidatus Buchananbacteria bacterium]
MEKLKPIILMSVACALIFLVISSWVFNYGWSILPYLILAGCFLVWVQKETVTYKFLTKLLLGALIFGFLSAVLVFFRMYVMSNFVYDNPMPISKLWDQDTRMMALVFFIISFVGGLIGVVLKGFYFLYKNKLDWVIVLLGPLLVAISSLAIFKAKIGGTIMSRLYGWPYPFLTHQIKDVLDGFSIDKWSFSPGSFYHYVIFDYLLYLILFLTVYFAIKLVNKKLKTKKINRTIFLFGFMVLLILKCTSAMSAKESYISYQIANAGYCQQNSDCVIVANQSPFSCAIVSNRDNADRILKLVNSYPSAGELQCLGEEKAICVDNKCRVLSYDNSSNETNWEKIRQAVENCEVASVSQTHSLEVKIILKNGKMIMAIEPEIDDIFDIVSPTTEKCGSIRMATE